MVMKIKYSLSTYSVFLCMCFCLAFLYLSNLGYSQPVSELMAITGPMPLVYLLTTMNWVPLYFVVILTSILVTAVLWLFAANCTGIPRYLAGLGVPIIWVVSGLFSLGISYYG